MLSELRTGRSTTPGLDDGFFRERFSKDFRTKEFSRRFQPVCRSNMAAKQTRETIGSKSEKQYAFFSYYNNNGGNPVLNVRICRITVQ